MSSAHLRIVTLALSLSAFTGCKSPRIEEAAAEAAAEVVRQNPLPMLDKPATTDERFAGHVEEVLRAGSYTYARLAAEDGGERWVVTMSKHVAVGDEVDVHNMGIKHAFRSSRLDRTFDELVFGIIRPRDGAAKER